MSRPKAPRPRVRLSKGERRQTILDAATDLLVADGPESLTMERVAARVGISKPVLYDHFANSGDLLAAVYDDYATYLVETVGDALAQAGGSLTDLIRASIEGYFEAVAAKGFVLRVLGGAAGREPMIRSARQQVRDRWADFWTAELRGRQCPNKQPACG
jgi:AcrR family transcriptional regulator